MGKADKRIRKALNELSMGQFQSVCEAACTNNITHITLLQRMDGGKSTAEPVNHSKSLQFPKKIRLLNALLTLQLSAIHQNMHLSKNLLKKSSYHIRLTIILQKYIKFQLASHRYSLSYIHILTACSHAIEVACIKDVTKVDLD